MDVLSVNYLLSNIVAYLLAQTHNFLWSKYWIFPVERRVSVDTHRDATCSVSTLRQVLFFGLAFTLAYMIQFLFLIILVELLSCNEYLAQFLGLFVYGTVNFLMNKRVTFKPI